MRLRKTIATLGLGILLTTLTGLSGCNRDDSISFYTTPKEPLQAQPTMSAMAGAQTPAPAAGKPIAWTAPAGWKELPGDGMRYASFAVTADNPPVLLTVIPLGAEAGELLPNVNRWQQQLGLPPSPESELAKVGSRIDAAGQPIDLVDLTGPAKEGQVPPRMLAAIARHGQRVWFFKMTGPATTIAAQKSAFEGFLKSIRFEDHASE